MFSRISRHREYFVHALYWLLYSLNHSTFYVDVVHCTLVEMGLTITAGTLLKLSLRQDFNMASYRDLLMNVSQKVRYADILYTLLTWLSITARVKVVLNRTVVDSFWRIISLWGSHRQSQIELYHVSWWSLTLVIDLIAKLSHDVIGCVSVKLRCYWPWRLEMSLVRFYSYVLSGWDSHTFMFINCSLVICHVVFLFCSVVIWHPYVIWYSIFKS